MAALREVLGPLVPEEAILQVGFLALNPEHPYLPQSIFGYCGGVRIKLLPYTNFYLEVYGTK